MKNYPGFYTGLAVVFLIVFCVSFFRYYEYVVNKDFYVYATTTCDPTLRECFVYECLEEDCEEVPYAKVDILASEAPQCLLENSCEVFSCNGRTSCEITYCSEEHLEEGEICYSPTLETGDMEQDTQLLDI